ncbi:MAG TPA: SDR family NAD(P)-dependent oxidoreductase [Steroidobacteraceae bacterium]|nr:SDR family NAD(P)-dependent oxidoreductase [Steroidobacteraceae bacterium]
MPVWKNPVTVLITGATGGIGAALARSYAAAGKTLILHGRDQARLAAVCKECRERGARVLSLSFDLRDAQAAIEQLRAVSAQEAIDLAIVNAGVGQRIGNGEQVESLEAARELLAVNLEGALATVAGVLPGMSRRRSGQIALMSSLAALHGLARTPVYSASKAALKAYGESLRLWLAPRGIAVTVVLAGFVRTATTESAQGPRPGVISAERAAVLIRRGLERNRARIAFPWWLAYGLFLLPLLPPFLAERILRAAGFGR